MKKKLTNTETLTKKQTNRAKKKYIKIANT